MCRASVFLRFSPVREPGEDLPTELSASGSHPYASLVLRCLLSTGKYIRVGDMLGKGTGKMRVKERDLAFGVQCVIFPMLTLCGSLPRGLVRTEGIYIYI